VTRFVHFEHQPITPDEWADFCARHHLEHQPGEASNNVWRRGQIEAIFGYAAGQPAKETMLTTTAHDGEIADLACVFWVRFGGGMHAEQSVREQIVRDVN
jgi:hypothetical protein